MYDFAVLRQLRMASGLTLQQASERSGISASVISKLERNQTTAELETLFKLGRLFDMSATDLLALAEAPLAHRKKAVAYRSGDFRFQRIQYGNVQAFLGEAKAGATISRPEIHHDDLEVCWVLEGCIRLSLTHQVILVHAGESVQFDAVRGHSYEALSDVRLILMHLRKDRRY